MTEPEMTGWEDRMTRTVDSMVDALVAEDGSITDLTAELIATMEDGQRTPERKLLMMATAYATALKMLAVQKVNSHPCDAPCMGDPGHAGQCCCTYAHLWNDPRHTKVRTI